MRLHPLAVTFVAGLLAAAPGHAQTCTPLETRAPNGTGQQPAFAGQTRAGGITSTVAYDVTVVAKGLQSPWAVEPLPNGDLLVTEKPGTEQPIYYWDPVIAPSGSQVYTGNAFPAWRGSLFIGALGQKRLVRLTIANGKVTGEEHLLVDRNQRVRDVRQGPDGALYVVTDDVNGELWKIAPKP